MDYYTRLAKQSAEAYVRYHRVAPLQSPLPNELRRQQACYIHIFQQPGRLLKASFGHPLPRARTLAEEIIRNTILSLQVGANSTTRRADLASLTYTVSLVEPLQRISNPTQLNPDNYGLYIRTDQGNFATILPSRPGILTSDDQVATAFREGNIDARKEAVTMYRFEVQTYGEN